MAIRVRELSPDELNHIKHLSQSRTAPARRVERARIIQLASEGLRVPEIAGRLHIGADVVRVWCGCGAGVAQALQRPGSGRARRRVAFRTARDL